MNQEFTDVIIADITAGQKDHFFTEIAPCTLYLLYGRDAAIVVTYDMS